MSSSSSSPPMRLPYQYRLPSFSTFSGSAASSSSAAGSTPKMMTVEEDDALPLLMSMAQIQTKAAAAQQLPTISSLLPSIPASTAFEFSAPTSDRSSSSSPVPQSSPPSPSTLSPGLFVGSSSSSSSSSMSMSPGLFAGSSCSSSAASLASSVPSLVAEPYQQQHAAFNNLMELSDIISSTQKLPVPTPEAKREQSIDDDDSSNDDGGDEFDGSVSADSDGGGLAREHSPPVSSRTRRVTRNQQKQIDRIKSEIELERERARELEQTLQLALRERSKLLTTTGTQGAGRQVSFFNVLNATEDGSKPLVLVDLPRSHSLPSAPAGEMSDALRPSSEGRTRSAPMLPPIASIPGLSPYLARKRGSLPPPVSVRPISPFRPTVAVAADTAYARGPSRRRKSVDRDDADEDYDPMSGAKKVKRSRSMSERGRRLQGSGGARRRRSETQYHAKSGDADEDDHAGHAAAAFMAMRAKAIEEERHARESRLMDVVEGADQEDDVDDAEYHRSQQHSRATSGTHARRDSVLDFIKEHPHASFWLKARN